MKKTAAILLTAVCLTGTFLFGGCGGSGTFTQKSYTFEQSISGVTIDVSDREAEIGLSDDGRIHIDCFESEKEYYDISVTDGELTVKLVLDKKWTDFIGTKPDAQYRKIKLQVPDAMLSRLTVSTKNEAIKVSPLSVKESIILHSNGGDVDFEKIFAGQSLSFTAKNGNITGSVIGGWDDYNISCTIKKGESNLPASKPDGAKSLIANCNNGDIQIEFFGK